MCLPLVSSCVRFWEQMKLRRQSEWASNYLPTGDALQVWLLIGTIALLLIHNTYRAIIAGLEGHAVLEVLSRVAMLCAVFLSYGSRGFFG